jgi:hypothetical protein
VNGFADLAGRRLDVGVLLFAAFMNVVVAPADFKYVLLDGTIEGSGGDWVADNVGRWQAGWSIWFVVTLSFAWSFYALGRHLTGRPPQLVYVAIAMAAIAAAVDCVGIVVNIALVPHVAVELGEDPAITTTFTTVALLSHALTDVAAVGLYSVAAVLIVPALFTTMGYPRPLAWVAVAECVVAVSVTAVLALGIAGADQIGREFNLTSVLATLAFLLYGLWMVGSAWWLLGQGQRSGAARAA